VAELAAAGSRRRRSPGPSRSRRSTMRPAQAAWTGARLAIGGLSFLFGAFAFAYFYCSRPTRTRCGCQLHHPAHVLRSADHRADRGERDRADRRLQQIKAGKSKPWTRAALAALVLGLVGVAADRRAAHAAVPAASRASPACSSLLPGGVGVWLCAMIWLEILFMRGARSGDLVCRAAADLQ